MKKILIIFTLIAVNLSLFGQLRVTIQECQQWAVEQSTAGKRIDDLSRLRKLNHQLSMPYIPNISINANVSYRSQVLDFSEVKGAEDILLDLSKDQYLVSLEWRQNVWDGGVSTNKQKIENVNSEIEIQNVYIETYQLKEEIGKLFLNLLYLQESKKVINANVNTLQEDLKKMQALHANGIILGSNVDILEAELMKIEQTQMEMLMQQRYVCEVLSEYTHKDLSSAEFVMQEIHFDTALVSKHPEMVLFELKEKALDYQKKALLSNNIPKLSFFAIGSYGRPTYNLLSNKFDWMYVVGAKLHVPVTGWGMTKGGKDFLEIQKSILSSNSNDYQQRLKIQMLEKLNEIKLLQHMIERDSMIIEKRISIVEVHKKQLEEGVITASDYIKEFNAMNEAVLNQKLHVIQLEQAKMNLNSLKGSL